MQPLRTKKIMQPLGGKKSCIVLGQQNHATSQDKQKPRNLSGLIKMQPVGTKKKNHATSQDKKNHATSWDKKKSFNFLGQKNQAISWDKKSCNLLKQQKITLPIGPIAFKLVHKAPNCSK